MKINKITIRGEKQPGQSTFESADDLKLEEVYLLGSSTRGEAERHTIQLKKDQVVDFEKRSMISQCLSNTSKSAFGFDYR